MTQADSLLVCMAYHDRPATSRRHTLCHPCYVAVWRRVQRGEPWDDAVEDRRRQVERAAKGWASGKGKRTLEKER